MAKLVESLAVAGSRKADGTANASGKAWAFVIGTSTQTTVYADADGTVALTQPVVLDAAGKATIYIDQPITLRVETSTGASLQETDVQDAAGAVAVANAGFTGTLPSGSQGAGGVTDLDTVLTSALTSFGGTDFRYAESSGATSRNVSAWMREVQVSLKDLGAYGDNTHDDTAAIQAAVNRVVAIGGGTVFVPAGTYLVSSLITKAAGASVAIRGLGPASILKNTNTGAGVFSFAAAGTTSISDEVIELNSVRITHASGSTGTAIVGSGYGIFRLLNSQVSGHQGGVSLSSGLNPWNVEVTGNVIVTTSNAASVAISLQDTTRTVLVNNYLSAPLGTCLSGPTLGSVFVAATSFASSAKGFSTTSGALVVTMVGCSFGGITTKLTLPATMPDIRLIGCGIDGYSVNVTSGGTVVPDLSQGQEILITGTTTGAAYTISPPSPLPASTTRGYYLTVRTKNAAGGAITGWNFNAIYHFQVGGAFSTTDLQQTTTTFLWDGAAFRAVSQVITTT